MCLSAYSTDRPGKSKVSDFIGDLIALLLKEYIFRLDVPMDEVLLVDALESLHDFHDDLDGMPEGEDLAG